MENKDKVCPKLAEECDYKCGFDVHMSKESSESNICISCEG